MFIRLLSQARILLLALGSLVCAQASAAETLSGSNVDNRVLVAVNAPSQAIQELLPQGWTSVPFPGGPLEGANVLFVFVDSLLQRNADGEPLTPATRRALALASLGKQGDAVRVFVLRIYTTTPETDPYEVNVAADISRTTTLEGPANDGRNKTEEWVVQTSGQNALRFALDYTTGKRNWAPAEAFPHSAANPDFSRIYRINQLTDLVSSKALGKASSGTFSLTSDLPDLSAVLDGSEEIMAVIDVPMYVRDVFLP